MIILKVILKFMIFNLSEIKIEDSCAFAKENMKDYKEIVKN